MHTQAEPAAFESSRNRRTNCQEYVHLKSRKSRSGPALALRLPNKNLKPEVSKLLRCSLEWLYRTTQHTLPHRALPVRHHPCLRCRQRTLRQAIRSATQCPTAPMRQSMEKLHCRKRVTSYSGLVGSDPEDRGSKKRKTAAMM